MAKATGDRIGAIRSARMEVFQIILVNSTEVNDSGVNDTSSWDKKVTAVVSPRNTIRSPPCRKNPVSAAILPICYTGTSGNYLFFVDDMVMVG